MPTRIGISGFGAIGRRVLRAVLGGDYGDIEVAAVNDMLPNGTVAHLFKYDSTYGTWPGEVGFDDEALLIAQKKVSLFHERDPHVVPWERAGVEIVLECTGLFRKRAQAASHLRGTVKKVIISAPGSDEDVMLIYGVNEGSYDPAKHDVISNGSCTTNCLVPVVKVLDDAFGVDEALFTTVHSYTRDQSLLDGAHEDLRRARTAAENIIPTSTGAAKAVTEVLPHLQGKITGHALRVPTPSVSIVDVNARLKKPAEPEDVNDAYRRAAQGPMGVVLGIVDDPVVSSDLRGNPLSAIVDTPLTTGAGSMVKVFAWYDNEWGYATRMADIANYVAGRLR